MRSLIHLLITIWDSERAVYLSSSRSDGEQKSSCLTIRTLSVLNEDGEAERKEKVWTFQPLIADPGQVRENQNRNSGLAQPGFAQTTRNGGNHGKNIRPTRGSLQLETVDFKFDKPNGLQSVAFGSHVRVHCPSHRGTRPLVSELEGDYPMK